MMKDKIKKGCLYIFVNLNGDSMKAPDYFICTSDEALEKVKQYSTRGIISVTSLNTDKYKNRWDKLQRKTTAKKKLIIAT